MRLPTCREIALAALALCLTPPVRAQQPEVVRYDRDTAGRLITAYYSSGTNEAAIHYQYDPNGNRCLRLDIARNDMSMDFDGNGLPDLWQLRYFSDLNQTGDGDPDGDGLANSNEYAVAGNPTTAHTDGDGQNDLEEFIAGTLLNSATSYFMIAGIAMVGGGTTRLEWAGVSGRTYQMKSVEELVETWTNTGPPIHAATSGVMRQDYPAGSNLFYRLGVSRP